MNCTIFPQTNYKEIVSDLKNSPELPFSNVLSIKEISKKMQEVSYRERIFTPEITLLAFLSQVMDDDHSQQAAVTKVIATLVANGKEPPSSNTSAYSQARSRLSEDILASLVRTIAEELASDIPSNWLWMGRKIKLVDGSTLSMPDTLENQAMYPQTGTQKFDIGFPIARVVVLIDYITGVVMDLAIGAYSGKETGEHALFRQLVPSLACGDILLGDRYYPSFFLMATLIQLGVDGVFPIHSARKYDFNQGISLGANDHIIEWKKPTKPEWMGQDEYDAFPVEITVREVAIDQHRNGFRSRTMVLVTTFLDPIAVTRNDLANLYDYRWFVELSLRDIKTTMHMDILRGKSPDMVRKEIWVHLLAYNLIRKIMAQAAFIHEKSTKELSFKLALQTIKAFQRAGILDEDNHHVYLKLLDAIVTKKVGHRNGRQEPRNVKRRPKAFPRLQHARGFYKNAA